METVNPISLESMLGAADRCKAVKSADAAGRSQAGPERFELPDDVTVGDERSEAPSADEPRQNPTPTPPNRRKAQQAAPDDAQAVNPHAAGQAEATDVDLVEVAAHAAVEAVSPQAVAPIAADAQAGQRANMGPWQGVRHPAAESESVEPAGASGATQPADAPAAARDAEIAQAAIAGHVADATATVAPGPANPDGETPAPSATPPPGAVTPPAPAADAVAPVAAEAPTGEQLGVAPPQTAVPAAAHGETVEPMNARAADPPEAPVVTQNAQNAWPATATGYGDATAPAPPGPTNPAGENAAPTATPTASATDPLATPAQTVPTSEATVAQAAQTSAADPTSPASQAGGEPGSLPDGEASAARTNRGEGRLSGMARHGAARAAFEGARQSAQANTAEVDPNLQAQSKLVGRSDGPVRGRIGALPDSAEPARTSAAEATAAFEGARQAAEAAQTDQADAPTRSQAAVDSAGPADQIIENVRQAVRDGQRDVTINLNPPDLGRVRLRMYAEGDEIRGRFEVDNPRTLDEIRHQSELLVERLTADGIALRRLEVHPMSGAGGQHDGPSSQQQDPSGQMPWAQGRGEQASPDRAQGQAHTVGAALAGGTPRGDESAHTGSLNVWI